jgi:hypothetical protein
VAWVKSRGLNKFLQPDSLNSVVPSLDFYIFAGRRHNIDLTPATHDAWSKLLKYNNDLKIKSYDYIIDAFLDSGDQIFEPC